MKWFKHDTDASNDAKVKKLLIKYGVTGYGIYFHCIELIANDINEHNITFELEHDSEIIADNLKIKGTADKSGIEIVEEIMRYIIDLGLFTSQDEKIFCFKLLKRLDTSMTSSPKFRAMITEAKDNHDLVMTESCKKRVDKSKQEEKRRDYTVTDSIIDYYNETTGQKRKHSKTSRTPIHARLGDYSIDDCKHVINVKYAEWKDDPKMSQYITIETFFRPSNFEKYLNQKIVEKKTGSTPTKEEIKNKDYKAGWND